MRNGFEWVQERAEPIAQARTAARPPARATVAVDRHEEPKPVLISPPSVSMSAPVRAQTGGFSEVELARVQRATVRPRVEIAAVSLLAKTRSDRIGTPAPCTRVLAGDG
jgi:hypothetical protein